MNEDDENNLALRKGDYVETKDKKEMGRIIGPGSTPGTWRVMFYEDGERDVPEDNLDFVY
jgi:hypothetical protein